MWFLSIRYRGADAEILGVKEQWLRCRGSEDHAYADVEGVEDKDDAERRGVGRLDLEPRLCVEGG